MRISEAELVEWQVLWSIEPPLADRIELAIATLTSLTANINRDSRKRPDAFTAMDFLPGFGLWERPELESESEMLTNEQILARFDQLIELQDRSKRAPKGSL